MSPLSIEARKDYWHGRFEAMASPCEVLVETGDRTLARSVIETVAREVWRIEQKFSRYRQDNIIHQINHADGKPVMLDEESARLIDFSDQLFQMSDGLFDITSGVLRKIWQFDGSDRVPEQDQIDALLKDIGWQRVCWEHPHLALAPGMQIDLGGIGKEYAVDRGLLLARSITDDSVLINLGGDLACTGARKIGGYWSVGRMISSHDQAVGLFRLIKGAIATSGDANRFLLKDGQRFSHILNPKTGWPIMHAPHTISVAAASCVEAGMFSTLALLQGAQAEEFLQLQQLEYWLD